MLSVQKTPTFSLAAPGHFHRRHPSAPPSVVVQPTRTPGLLSISKPQHQPQQRQRSSPKAKHAQAARSSPQAAPAVAALQPPAEIDSKLSQSAEKTHIRGRQSKTPKDKASTTRTSSPSARPQRRSNTRQQSPSSTRSQAEPPSPPTTRKQPAAQNSFDPFIDNSDNSSSDFRPKPVRPAPQLTSRPTGKLAKRRQRAPAPPNTPSRPVPVPKRQRSLPLSRSEPVVSHMPAVKGDKDVFPICDDMTEVGDDDELSLPSTPTRRRASQFDNGPMTAPITSPAPQFPFKPTFPSTTSPKRNARKHKRAPSDGGVFQMSDEDSSSQDLLTFVAMRQSQARSAVSGDEDEDGDAAGFFASSQFQNSPSPEELPDPVF